MNYYTTVLKKYAVFSGRAARKEFWMFTLFNSIVSIIVSLVGSLLGLTIHHGMGTVNILNDLYYIAVFLPSLAVGIRRLHDIGKSGWWVLIAIIPFLGALVLIIFACFDSTPGDNQYGPNPKGVGSAPSPSPTATV